MIGSVYWATGITVRWRDSGAWGASLKFYDDGFCDTESTEGILQTRYWLTGPDALTRAVDLLIADASRLGIRLPLHGGQASLYVEGDGENNAVQLPPDWRELLAAQAARLGWDTPYPPAPPRETP